MEPFLALSAYDIFVYLLVGIATLACLDLIVGTRFIFRPHWGAGVTTMIVILGYVIGQIASWPAEIIFQDFMVAGVVGYPTTHLVPPLDSGPSAQDAPICAAARNPPLPDTSESKEPRCACLTIWHAVSGHYFQALPWDLQQRIRRKAPLHRNCKIDHAALYFEASAAARKDVNSFERAATFSRLAVFCRNIATVALFAFAAALYNSLRGGKDGVARPPIRGIQPWLNKPSLQALLFFLVGFGIFARFLYFYRQNALEVLTTYAYAPFPID